jgi:hypothetical protein
MRVITEEQREVERTRSREYRKKNPEKVRDGYERWRNSHREMVHAQNKRWREAHPAYNRERQLSQYGMTIADFDGISELSGGRCWICDGLEKLQVDHDHATGEVRGLLCHKCNKTLGLFNDDPKLFMSALKYLNGGNLEGLWGRTKI